MFKLYYAPGTCALATHIALEEVGASYEAVLVDFRSQGQRSPAYLAINPKGRVPALMTENGILTETPALLCFVAQLFPKAELAPPRGSVCPRGGSGIQQLSLLDSACRARPPDAGRGEVGG
jgi:glutathione S-transferase